MLQHSRFKRSWLFSLLAGIAVASIFAPATAKADSPDISPAIPQHLSVARQLVTDLQNGAQVNEYGEDPTYIHWATPTVEARTVCGSFITHLLEHTYGWDASYIKHWLSAGGKDATEWHDAIVQENGFQKLNNISDIHPGDFLAVKYNDGSKDTGHIMLVDHDPEPIASTEPIEPGTSQYSVEVIDSSASGHGKTDTRHLPDGTFTGGIGRGVFRLYTNADGTIAGYSWSITHESKFYQSPGRDLVMGRLKQPTQ